LNIGFFINPIAGMGGKVALKGTDGTHALDLALSMGAKKVSPDRAFNALKRLTRIKDKFTIFTPPGSMGEAVLVKTTLSYEILKDVHPQKRTSANDTRQIIEKFIELKLDMIVFAGGDGTACDICSNKALNIPVIGIPSGVKMHSAVFGINPERAGDLIAECIEKKSMEYISSEIMDIDESALIKGVVSTKLSGYLKTPYKRTYSQSAKSSSPPSDKAVQMAICQQISEIMEKDIPYLVGPGTTLSPLYDLLNLENTLLGFDLIINQKLVQKDLTENDILNLKTHHPLHLILTPIGGQGHILGRGNQQISPNVLSCIENCHIIIAATSQKLASLKGKPLLIDTGNKSMNERLKGYKKIITGFDESMIMKVEH